MHVELYACRVVCMYSCTHLPQSPRLLGFPGLRHASQFILSFRVLHHFNAAVSGGDHVEGPVRLGGVQLVLKEGDDTC